ncbi:MAG: hypothetical protein IPO08_19720 [Xanthomonadales bacterium]|nr:hypothetical protein [Xanthomonadales bacterium]
MELLPIKRGIPVPTVRSTLTIYPFAEMQVGDCFDAPRDKGRNAHGKDMRQLSVAAAAASWAKRNKAAAKFSARLLDEHNVRCWRIA